MTQRAVVPSEGGEDDGALVRLVTVLKEVLEHGRSFAVGGLADIRAAP